MNLRSDTLVLVERHSNLLLGTFHSCTVYDLGRNKILKYKQDIKGKQLVLVKKRDGDICDSELVKALKKGELEAYQREELFGGPHVYSINSLPPLYNQYQDGPVDYKSFNKVILSSPKALQNIANSTESYFRVNGVTYKYQEK